MTAAEVVFLNNPSNTVKLGFVKVPNSSWGRKSRVRQLNLAVCVLVSILTVLSTLRAAEMPAEASAQVAKLKDPDGSDHDQPDAIVTVRAHGYMAGPALVVRDDT